jgi:hypothetical protein
MAQKGCFAGDDDVRYRSTYPCNSPWKPIGFETSRLPYFLYNRLTDGDEFVGITRRPLFTPRKIPGTYFC